MTYAASATSLERIAESDAPADGTHSMSGTVAAALMPAPDVSKGRVAPIPIASMAAAEGARCLDLAVTSIVAISHVERVSGVATLANLCLPDDNHVRFLACSFCREHSNVRSGKRKRLLRKDGGDRVVAVIVRG